MTELLIPSDITDEEIALLDLVKTNMLRRLTDREKFVFVYCYDLGRTTRQAGEVLQIDHSNVVRLMKHMREVLAPFSTNKA